MPRAQIARTRPCSSSMTGGDEYVIASVHPIACQRATDAPGADNADLERGAAGPALLEACRPDAGIRIGAACGHRGISRLERPARCPEAVIRFGAGIPVKRVSVPSRLCDADSHLMRIHGLALAEAVVRTSAAIKSHQGAPIFTHPLHHPANATLFPAKSAQEPIESPVFL
jgi:hypothetical protein